MIRNLYPFSTVDGKVIPLDILRPLGVLRVPFTATATAVEDIGIPTPIMVLRASENCFISFGVVATVPSTAMVENLLFLEAGEVLVAAPHTSKYSVISDGVDGVLTLQLIDRWAGLAEESSYKGVS